MAPPDRIIALGDERLIVSPKTLVAGDDRDLIATCVRLLERLGHRCLTTHSARDAIALIQAEELSLALADFRLPLGRGGLEVVQHARTKSPPVPAILMTAYDSAELQWEAQQAGALYLPKPFSIADFRTAIQQAILPPPPCPLHPP
jgi:two-component system, NtrC family, response regulator HydG